MKNKEMVEKKEEISYSDKEKALKLAFDFDLKRHEMRMQELEFQRESDRLHHERELERGRIKSAEIRKDRMWRENKDYSGNYWKDNKNGQEKTF